MSDENDDVVEIVQSLKKVIDKGGADAGHLRIHLAQVLLKNSQFDESFAQCRSVLDDDPGHVAALECASRALRGLQRTDQAERYLATADLIESAHLQVRTQQTLVPVTTLPGLKLVPASGEARTAITLEDIAGMAAVKRRLMLSFLGPLKHPELRALYGKSLRGGLMLWGPPGCGKTYLARAIAGELGAKFISVGLDEVLDMYTGQSEKNIHSIFESARRQAPCVLFFDEIDALGQKRSNLGGGSRNVIAQLLTELDGVSEQNEGLFVLGATNHPWDVDTALRRPGRFGRMLLVLPPDAAAREAILQMNLRDRPTDALDLATIAQATTNFSGADLVQLCETATEFALESAMTTGQVRPIVQADMILAVNEARPSTTAWLSMARNYAEFANEGGTYDDLLDYLRSKDRR